jgi:uncharacterized protein (TIGR02145 family)
VAENDAFTGSTPVISDASPIGTLTYTLGGADAANFTITSTTGVIAMVARDFEAPADANTDNAYAVTIIVTDADDNTANVTQTVTVTDVTETVTFTIGAIDDASVTENTEFTGSTPVISGASPIGTLTYTLGGDDAADFTINSTTGVIAMVARDFEGPADANTDNVYAVTIIATDADDNAANVTQTVTVTNVLEGSVGISAQSRSIAENSANNTNVGEVLETTGSPTGFKINSGNTNDAFAISSVGQVTVANSVELNFETTISYTLAVEITKDDTTSQNAVITITVTNVNEGSVGISDQMLEIDENSANNTNVGEVLVTTGSPTHFSITDGNTNDTFAISNAGQISVLNSDQLDIEATPSYTLVVEIVKADTDSQSAEITIDVTDFVLIGEQKWSRVNAELVPNSSEYDTLGTDYWTDYDATTTKGDGYYYTWDAAMNVCRSGWRLPSDDDWKELERHVGMTNVDGGGWRGIDEGTQLKVGGSSGLEAKLTGLIGLNGTSISYGETGEWWTSTSKPGDDTRARRRSLRSDDGRINSAFHVKGAGRSVRCLKN